METKFIIFYLYQISKKRSLPLSLTFSILFLRSLAKSLWNLTKRASNPSSAILQQLYPWLQVLNDIMCTEQAPIIKLFDRSFIYLREFIIWIEPTIVSSRSRFQKLLEEVQKASLFISNGQYIKHRQFLEYSSIQRS